MPSPFPGMDPYLEDEALGRPSSTSWSSACTRSCCRAWWTATGPASASGTTSPSRPCSPRSSARSTRRTSSRSASAATAGWSRCSTWSARATGPRRGGRQAYLDSARGRAERRRQPRRDRPGAAGPADARLLARRPAGVGLRRDRDAGHPAGAATRSTPRRCRSACPASACRWPPTTATRCWTCTRPSPRLRPGRLRRQDRLRPRPRHTPERRPPASGSAKC